MEVLSSLQKQMSFFLIPRENAQGCGCKARKVFEIYAI